MFKHRLALALGCFVDDINHRMSSAELQDWQAYESAEPFGAKRDNYHAGLIAALIHNLHCDERDAPLSPDDFMLKSDAQRARESTRSLMRFMLQISEPEK